MPINAPTGTPMTGRTKVPAMAPPNAAMPMLEPIQALHVPIKVAPANAAATIHFIDPLKAVVGDGSRSRS